jgi:cation-transporting ATPase 13A3/4/5
VRRQSWYEPPIIDPEHSNSENSENTILFLISCFQYILSAIVLSVGKPFRQSMRHNLPFVVTMLVALGISTYMLFDPAEWVQSVMELTWTSNAFRVFILILSIGSFATSYLCERTLFPRLAKTMGRLSQSWSRTEKKRKEYKVITEEMSLVH